MTALNKSPLHLGFTIRYAIRTLIKTKVMQMQPPRVTRAIRILRALALAGIVSSAIEIFMLAEVFHKVGCPSKFNVIIASIWESR